VLGAVRAERGLRAVEVFVAGDKVFARTGGQGGGGAGTARAAAKEKEWPIDAAAPLEVGPNRVLVEATSLDGVTVSRQFWVLGEGL